MTNALMKEKQSQKIDEMTYTGYLAIALSVASYSFGVWKVGELYKEKRITAYNMKISMNAERK